MSKNHKHKRQKSNVSNPNYHFPPTDYPDPYQYLFPKLLDQPSEIPLQLPLQLPQLQPPTDLSQFSVSSQLLDSSQGFFYNTYDSLPQSSSYHHPQQPVTPQQQLQQQQILIQQQQLQRNQLLQQLQQFHQISPQPQSTPTASQLTPTSQRQSTSYSTQTPTDQSQGLYDAFRQSDFLTPVKQSKPPTHKPNNLSISSHFNLFKLHDTKSIPEYSLPQQSRQQGALPQKSRRIQLLQLLPQSTQLQQQIQFSPQRVPPSPIVHQNSVFRELLDLMTKVDAANVDGFLLKVLKTLQDSNLPIDEFYNLLYNDDKSFNYNVLNRIDKSVSGQESKAIIDELLNIFKSPSTFASRFQNRPIEENKLLVINYHELLRTFLAIKILFDIVIELPGTNEREQQNSTIPRLSIYKTYYILCQKLIATYPSSSNTVGEQQKLILGQSRLGKLIKLVYPDIVIKRLGSRGESKYNYLGVIWNENIVDEDIKKLCDQHEISELNNIYSNIQSTTKPLLKKHQHHHKRSSSKTKMKLENPIEFENQPPKQKPVNDEPVTETLGFLDDFVCATPNLSFVKPFSKYPVGEDFTILSDGGSNWFNKVANNLYFENPNISQDMIQEVFLNNGNLQDKSSLMNNLISSIITPLCATQQRENIDLKLYFVIVGEILPYLLLIKSSSIDIPFLKNLRLNLLHLVTNFKDEITRLDSQNFKIINATKFLIMIKKFININDLLITLVKLIMKNNTKLVMSFDIENFLTNNENQEQFEPTMHVQPDDSLFMSLSANVGNTSGGDVNFNFKSDILSNDLIYTLVGYKFDPTTSSVLNSPVSMGLINQEIGLIETFFKKELLMFLNESGGDHTKPHFQQQGIHNSNNDNTILSTKELDKLIALFKLIDQQLLSGSFKSKYPIPIYNNLINFILNDILKFIFLKQQQLELQNIQFPTDHPGGGGEHDEDNSQNSFGNWWVFNSFIQEYISLIGEIVGLYDSL
jgi:hypothetical protein